MQLQIPYENEAKNPANVRLPIFQRPLLLKRSTQLLAKKKKKKKKKKRERNTPTKTDIDQGQDKGRNPELAFLTEVFSNSTVSAVLIPNTCFLMLFLPCN